MADKCRKMTSNLVLCDEMALAVSHNLLRLQTLSNRTTGTSRERIVLKGKAGHMPLWYCPFCRINIAIPPAPEAGQEG